MMSIPSLRHIVIGCTLVVFVGYGAPGWNGVYSAGFGLSAGEPVLIWRLSRCHWRHGTLFGGWLADWLAQKDKRYYVWLTAGVKLAILPIAYWYYLTTTVTTAILLTTITSFFGGFYLSVSFALKSLLPPARRARLGFAFCLHQYCLVALACIWW